MTTLADELLADLLDDGSDAEDQDSNFGEEDAATKLAGHEEDVEMSDEKTKFKDAAAAGTSALDNVEDEQEARERVEKVNFANINDVSSISGLSKQLDPVLEKIQHYKSLPDDKQMSKIGSIEDHPEYKLLVSANSLSSNIDNEIILIHKFIRDHYSVRYPELETLIQNPLLYARAVAVLGNGPFDNASMERIVTSSDNLVGQTLKQVLDGPTLMVIRLEAVKTTGRELSSSELETVQRACSMSLQLDKAKDTLTDYVQSRMSVFSPNLTALIGPETAALIVNYAGSLKNLANTPSTNLPSFGNKKQTFGMATNTRVRRQGFLYHSPMIQELPENLRNQGMRIVSAKAILAARVDLTRKSADASSGEKFKEECLTRLDKLTAPPPNSGTKALPAPDDKPSRKRGGRRARAAKEQYAQTELQRAQNRLAFGKEEVEVGFGDETEGLGMIGSSSTDGRVRATQIDQRTKAKLSKKNPGWGFETPGQNQGGLASSLRGFGSGAGNATVLQGHGLRTSGVGAGAGTSSVIFSQHQGLELVNPKAKEELERKRKAEEDGWFKSGTFTQVGTAETPKTDSAGFKVPALPAIKRVKQLQ